MIRGVVRKAHDGMLRTVRLDGDAWLALGLAPGQHVIVMQGDFIMSGEVWVDRRTGERMVLTYATLSKGDALVRRPRLG